MSMRWTVAIGTAVALSATMAQAETVRMSADLAGQSEVPPVQTPATGTAIVSVDTVTRAVQWVVQVRGLSGPLTAAHFHCPAAVGENVPVAIPISGAGGVSPLKGSATVNAAQIDNLLAGRCYVNVHTAQHPTGEIRGQVLTQ